MRLPLYPCQRLLCLVGARSCPLALRRAPDPCALGRELRAQAFGRVEEMFDLDQVILAVEERPELLQFDLVADAQVCFRLGHTAPCEKAARAQAEERLGFSVRRLTVERKSVRERLFARAELRLQDAHAALVAVKLAADRRIGRFILQRLLAPYVPTVDGDARALHGEIGEHAEGTQLGAVFELGCLIAAPLVRLR